MKKFIITVNGQPYEVEVEEVKGPKNIASSPVKTSTPAPEKKAVITAPLNGSSASSINAPMPGNILKIKVGEGDSVKKGQPLLILEAMKMENEITAPADGKVVAIRVSPGECVVLGQPLIELG
jgi:glutaconyl-CoA/methylmalonyl-CoA decarboxylase subunit gamma